MANEGSVNTNEVKGHPMLVWVGKRPLTAFEAV